ncbi:hypothetical protein CYMTET_45981 [Cymbomonas tetramitiformis]|uniref:C2H2-type domain-containing protein n=1 Tax=Cymbomonas tetramitiformis TaxID=36881 RepID=A0AAE0EY15_9CHLO|nr:hypothetical protein CYMTET_45981 [Cymbomonas tetramitiformis]
MHSTLFNFFTSKQGGPLSIELGKKHSCRHCSKAYDSVDALRKHEKLKHPRASSHKKSTSNVESVVDEYEGSLVDDLIDELVKETEMVASESSTWHKVGSRGATTRNRPPVVHKVKALDSIHKLLDGGMTLEAAAQAMGVPPSNVRRWLGNEKKLREQAADPKAKHKRGFGGPKRGRYDDIARDLLGVYKRRRAGGFKHETTNPQRREQAF